jgi:uncharacterized protein
MADFTLHMRDRVGDIRDIIYSNSDSTLIWQDTGKTVMANLRSQEWGSAVAVSKDVPGSKHDITLLKISLGLACNFSCGYCSQRFVPHAIDAGMSDVQPFLDGLQSWFDVKGHDGLGGGLRIEFWGGEPFVYWKTLRPLAEALRVLMPNAQFSVITNGSLLTLPINIWLVAMGFNVAISHDGPGQPQRGPDPLENPETRSAILDLYRQLRPLNRISINAMLTRTNSSRAAIADYLVKIFGDDLIIGEGTFVDPYDAGGMAAMLRPAEHSTYRKESFLEIANDRATRFTIIDQKIIDFIGSIRDGRPARALGQKCGMDRTDSVAVTLKGDVLTCQNVSPVAKAPNGKHHKLGNVSNLASVKLATSTHWSGRDECPKCPVLQLCKGACMFLEGKLFESACDTSYSDNLPILVAAIQELTGMIIVGITGPQRVDRQVVWE